MKHSILHNNKILFEMDKILFQKQPEIWGEWLFQGNANDTSGNNYNGVVTGAQLTTNRFDVENEAYLFNGTGEQINMVCSKNFTDFTTELWFKAEVRTGVQHLFCFQNNTNRVFFNYVTNRTVFAASTGENSMSILNYIPTDNLWHKLKIMAYKIDGSNHASELWIDDVYKGKATKNFGIIETTHTQLRFGDWLGSPAYPFYGKLDEIRMYNGLKY